MFCRKYGDKLMDGAEGNLVDLGQTPVVGIKTKKKKENSFKQLQKTLQESELEENPNKLDVISSFKRIFVNDEDNQDVLIDFISSVEDMLEVSKLDEYNEILRDKIDDFDNSDLTLEQKLETLSIPELKEIAEALKDLVNL
ncbi:MAG: hypothetical protein QXG00_08420 [Candidatus Woesearchaeota archaeon]